MIVLEVITDMGYLLLMVLMEGISCIVRAAAYACGFISGVMQIRKQRREKKQWERNHDLK